MIAHARPDSPTYRVHEDPPAQAEESAGARDPLGPLRENLRLLSEQAAYYLSLRKDQLRLKVRSTLLYAVMGIVGAIIALTALVVASALLLNGVALGIGELFGGRPWAGQVITGAGVLLAAAGGGYFAMHTLSKSSRVRTVKKYEGLQHRQRTAAAERTQSRTEAPL